eukprot:INCI19172.1.p1 GENE.INCI19172.1~~INCI19172.1.p1  ORF type:complete len:508 (-),score=110.83 INCI19172.1:166-1689(-)
MSKVYNEVKKKRQHVHARSVVELHFWNSQSNAPLEIPLSLLAGKGPQFFLDELLNHAMTHISFDEEQMELLSLHFIFRGRRLNYNGIKFIEQNAEKMPVTIIHVELNFNYEKVADYVLEIKQLLVNLTSSHNAAFVRIETVKVKYDRIMKHYIKNARALEYRLEKLLEEKEYAVVDRDYSRADAVTKDIEKVSANLDRLQNIIDGHFPASDDEEQGLKYLREYNDEIQSKSKAFDAQQRRFLKTLEQNVDKIIGSFKKFLREDNDTKDEYEGILNLLETSVDRAYQDARATIHDKVRRLEADMTTKAAQGDYAAAAEIKEKFEAAKAHRQRVDDYSLAGALDIYSRYRQFLLPGAPKNHAAVHAAEFNGNFEYDFILNCRHILKTVNDRLNANLDSLRVYLEKLTRYKVFAVELDVLKPPVDELELIGLGISPIKQRPHNVPQKQLDLRRSALKNERSGSAQKRPDSVPKQLFATHRENQGYSNRNTNRNKPAPHLRHSSRKPQQSR